MVKVEAGILFKTCWRITVAVEVLLADKFRLFDTDDGDVLYAFGEGTVDSEGLRLEGEAVNFLVLLVVTGDALISCAIIGDSKAPLLIL